MFVMKRKEAEQKDKLKENKEKHIEKIMEAADIFFMTDSFKPLVDGKTIIGSGDRYWPLESLIFEKSL